MIKEDTTVSTSDTAPQIESTTAEDADELSSGERAAGEALFQAALDVGSDSDEPEGEESEDKNAVLNLAYVLAHRKKQFHHIGDGHYKRGPKPKKDDGESKGEGARQAASSSKG